MAEANNEIVEVLTNEIVELLNNEIVELLNNEIVELLNNEIVELLNNEIVTVRSEIVEANEIVEVPSEIVEANEIVEVPSEIVEANEIVEVPSEIVEANEIVEVPSEIVEANEIVEVLSEIVEANELVEASEDGRSDEKTCKGAKAAKFIIGLETIERLGTVGTLANLMVFLKYEFHITSFTAMIIINIFNVICNFTTAFGGFFADSFFGRYRALQYASCSTFLGMLLLTLTSTIAQLRPSPCKLQTSDECDGPTAWQLTFLMTSLGFLAVGVGGIRSCNNIFGEDQFDPKTDSGREELKSYSNWYDFSSNLATMVSQTVIVYVQVWSQWSIGLALPTVLMFCMSLVFFSGSKHYIRKIPDRSCIKTLAQVLRATIKKRSSELLDRSCNIQQMEEVKCVIKVIPIWVACIIYFLVQVQMGTSSIAQALQSDRRVSQNINFNIPAAAYSIFSLLALTIWIAIYDRMIIPKARKVTKTEDGISMLQRLGVGFFLGIITMIISGLVEQKRRAMERSQPILGFTQPRAKISTMSGYWLIPQYTIAGISEGFSVIGQLEFYNKQLPDNMRNFAQAFLYCGFGLSSLLSIFMVPIVHMITKNSKYGDWVPGDLNKGRLEYFYYFIGVLQMLNLIYFLVVAKRYKYIVVESKLLEVKTDDVNLNDHHINALPTNSATMELVVLETSRHEIEILDK